MVDDDPTIRGLLRALLEEDYDIVEASDGATTAQTCLSRPLDAVILDLRLPDCDGLNLLASLHASRPNLPVIMLTGVDNVATAVSAMKLGAADYLTKPIQLVDLLAVVGSALARNASPTPPAASPQEAARPPILLVGRDVATLGVLAALLEGKQSIRIAATTLQAIPHLDEPPGILILDDELPRLESMAFMNALRHAAPDCVVILAIGTSAPDHRDVWVPDRVDAVLRKPYRLADILTALLLSAKSRLHGRPLPSNPHVLDALEYIRQTPIQSIRTRRIANAIGVSPGHLAHLVRSDTGTTIDRILAQVKIALAEQFLLDPNQKLDSIAELTGFSDAAHLSRMFKRYRGLSPGEYRRWRAHLAAGGP